MKIKTKVYKVNFKHKEYNIYTSLIDTSQIHVTKEVYDYPDVINLDGNYNMYKVFLAAAKIMFLDEHAVVYLNCKNNEPLKIINDNQSHDFDFVIYRLKHTILKRSDWKNIKKCMKYVKSYTKTIKFNESFKDYCDKLMTQYEKSKYFHIDSSEPLNRRYDQEHTIFIEGSLEFFANGYIKFYDFITSEDRKSKTIKQGYSDMVFGFGVEAGYITNDILDILRKRG